MHTHTYTYTHTYVYREQLVSRNIIIYARVCP